MPFSIIPFSQNNVVYSNTGPAYIFRNIVNKSPERNNLPNLADNFNPSIYISYGGCEGTRNKVWSPGLKIQTGSYPANPRTDIHFYHNTVSVEDTLSYNFYLWKSTAKRIISKNNSWNANFTVANFEDVANQPNYGFRSINDNYFSNKNKLGVVNAQHGNLTTCATYSHLDSLDKYLRLTTTNADTTLLKIRGFNFAPNFVDQANGNFVLNTNSPLIDKGELINNLSDMQNENYFNALPDIGALEKQLATAITSPLINDITINIYPNPSIGAFQIKANKAIKQITIFGLDGKIVYTQSLPALTNSKLINNIFFGKGIYFIKTTFADKQTMTKKIVF
jgi:hypothetical protein